MKSARNAGLSLESYFLEFSCTFLHLSHQGVAFSICYGKCYTFLFIKIFIFRWYSKVAGANKFQQKNILNYTNNKLHTVVKLI